MLECKIGFGVFPSVSAYMLILYSEGPYLRKFLSGDKTAADKVDGLRQRLLSGLVEALDDRFDGDLPLFRDSSFLSITSWLDGIIAILNSSFSCFVIFVFRTV